jgi:hypothetical protein
MKKICSAAGLAALLRVLVSTPASSRMKSMTWTGWISDSSCGAKGANAVFVYADDKSVYAIANQPAVKDSDVGQKVKLTGKMLKNKSIQVTKIATSM